MGSVPAEKRGVANGIRMTVNQTAGVLSVPFALLLMTLVMPYGKLSQIVNGTQLESSNQVPIFLRAVNHACLILGIITLCAIVPASLISENTVELRLFLVLKSVKSLKNLFSFTENLLSYFVVLRV